MPKNIIMIGPTGVGKTEIARRLAKLTNSPFLKVEASKFTEVGYVGRDVESIVRDLVEISIDLVREEKLEDVEDKAELNAEDRLLDLLLPPASNAAPAASPTEAPGANVIQLPASMDTTAQDGPGPRRVDQNRQNRDQTSHERTREKLRTQFREGKLDERMVELDVRDRNQPSFEFVAGPGQNSGPDENDVSLKDILPGLFGQRTKKRKMKVSEAFEYLVQEEEQRLIDSSSTTTASSAGSSPITLARWGTRWPPSTPEARAWPGPRRNRGRP